MVAKWASIYGLKFDPKSNESPKAVAQFAEKLGKDERTALGQVLLLRSMKQAKYSVENVGHFGLASDAYLHFTSPIRRYPDLLVHRSLKVLWAKEGPPKDLEEQANHSSVQERCAMLIERDVTDLMACQIATHFVGEEMGARVVTVLPKGVFVRSIEHLFEGYISVEAFGDYYNEYFEFQEESMMLLGQLTGRRITFGTEVKVRLESVNSQLRRIDFTLADRMENRRPKKSQAKGRKPLVNSPPQSGPWAAAVKRRNQKTEESRDEGDTRKGGQPKERSGKKNRQAKKKRRRF
jgi:ribonuclease R